MAIKPAGKDAKIAGSVQQPHIIGVQELVGNGKSQVPSIVEPKMSFTRFTVQNAQGGWAT